jgi:hypothetical protein
VIFREVAVVHEVCEEHLQCNVAHLVVHYRFAVAAHSRLADRAGGRVLKKSSR